MKEDVDNFYRNTYEQNHVLSKCDDIVLEAKRVLLNEDIEKMASFSLSIVSKTQDEKFSTAETESSTRHCKNRIDWNDNCFWEDLPNPRNIDTVDVIPPVTKHFCKENQIVNMVIDELLHPYVNQNSDLPKSNDSELCQKYFDLWRYNIRYVKDQKETSYHARIQEKKLENLMKKLKISKKNRKKYLVTEKTQLLNNELKDSESLITNNGMMTMPPIKSSKSFGIYKHRFTAQKDIINKQKAKLNEQNKIIEELKFGIIREDLLKSIENTKVNIREIFANCSESVKCKVPITLVEEAKFTVNTQKAPNIIQKMEQRAVERAQKRQIIQERKRIMEEHRQRLLEEAIERKKCLEEEDKKRNLEIMKEKRRKELEMERTRQANKQRYLNDLDTAIKFHNRFVLRNCFRNLNDNMQLSRVNYSLACHHFENKILQWSINSWLEYIDDLYKVKNELADAHFEYKVLKQCLKTWKTWHLENIRNMQVAEDIYDFHLTKNTFIHWHRYVCIQIMLQDKYEKVAEEHYNRKILFHYYHQWMSLKAVMELEKAKELRKRRWREKVWEILPDYKPPEDF
ncbi:unnamed protein product [Phaedon cochleariae]|uniref:Coiled-coil domain-containing protein n=1 Tax=Phaedon cochleariae TaxID=80249 RepID=A0A9P0GML4_PHACE|nr:unnamed protein product [Phaedon cochleariae]